MVDKLEESPPSDLEHGPTAVDDTDTDGDDEFNPFDIVRTKNAPIDRLRRWRQSALVLNASRRFRYTSDLNREEEKRQVLSKIRTHAQVIRAATLFREAARHAEPLADPMISATEARSDEEIVRKFRDNCQYLSGRLYGVEREQLAAISREANLSALQKLGGVNGLAEKLRTNLEKGIQHNSDDDLFQRKSTFGPNSYPMKKQQSFWRFLWEACQDWTLLILIVAAMALLALGIKSEGRKQGWYNGGSILFAAIIVIVVTAISDYIQYLQFQKLSKEKRNIHVEVVRGGRRKEISIYDIVVGDVATLKIGDKVCADGVLISGHSLAIDESFITGESKIVTKDSRSPFLMAGCSVADGYGTMLVINVGIETEWGMLMASMSEEPGEETPFQVRLNGLATVIGKAGLQVAFVVMIVLLARYFTGHMSAVGMPHFKAGKTSPSYAIDGVIKILTVVVTIVIVAVPEGLPLAITLTLACLAKRMLRDNALVRRHSACETMGSATTICCDKTGTLTLNQMTVVEAYASGKKLDPPYSGLSSSPVLSSLLIEGIAQNTTGSVSVPEDGSDATVSGAPTEKAILAWGVELGMNFNAKRSETVIIHAFPFNSQKKRGGVAVQSPGSEVRIHWKGGADIVLASCISYMDENDQVVPLTEQKLDFYKNAIGQMASQSLRCIAIAYRSCEFDKEQSEVSQWMLPEDELILLAIVGLKDPCRTGVRGSIDLCKTAGLKVRMVTGDSLKTAKAIALECGILASDSDACEPNLINGESFRNMSTREREKIVDKISVMGNSSPNDKLLFVQQLKKAGHIVAVAADGTNDAPALHEADVGLAMGIAGTEVAKESSDIVILDDDFASVVKIVQWGRSVYTNIQKFTQFQLTVNVVALIINVAGAFSTGDVPLNCVQLLWVYLMTYTLGALALATEPPTEHLMRRPPVSRR
ncbi:calcium-transporting ATPase 10, plasma membrane-type-like isoform X2 [Silene latifolia]